jgi:beta-N-acetylhexosaminidase
MLALPELSSWRGNGGLLVSDDLGSQAVRVFYTLSGESLSAALVARDAFLAGNDLLYLGNIVSGDEADTYSTTINVLEFFAQRYREDQAFAQSVDEAVLRILTRKYQLFGNFQISDVLVPDSAQAGIGQSQQLVFDVARRSATLISPDAQELASLLPSPPALRDRLVFITDTVQYTQCSDCQPRFSLSYTALQDAIVRLYGPTAGGQVSEARLNSYTFEDLTALLNGAELENMLLELNRANWIVFVLADSSQGQPDLISRFLSERRDLLLDKRIVLFSFTAPYYFDATDISKLTAYYGLYSKQPAFIDMAARLLYQEMPPAGFSPVSIPGTGYDLIDVTRPNPDQIITLSLDVPPDTTPTSEPTSPSLFTTQTPVQTIVPEPTSIPLLRIGDTVYVRTGTILDHNQHVVPDGTVVRFTVLLSGEGGGIIQQVDQVTTRGIARASFALEKPGLVQIRASSEPATLSNAIQIDVSPGQAAVITVIPPLPSETIEPTPVPPTPVEEDDFVTLEGYPRLTGWMFAIMFVGLSALLTYWASSQLQSRLWGWRWGICVLLGGLIGYNYATLGLPGSSQIVLANGILGVLFISGVGELVGLGLAWIWSRQA